MKIVIFGTGVYYQKYKRKIPKNIKIVALLDNNKNLWNTFLDDIRIYSPQDIFLLKYDKIILLSARAYEMKAQLISQGIFQDNIWYWGQFNKYLYETGLNIYYQSIEIVLKKKILVISHELNYDGASMAIVYAIKALKNNGFSVSLVIPEANEKLVNEIIKDIHLKLTGGKEIIRLSYESGCGSFSLEEAVGRNRERDIRTKSASVGPHRDDIIFMINGMDAKKYGSQGQQRTVALSLKLAEIELVKRLINDNPILLLDDVMSELDSTRRDALLSSISGIQTIITCTGYDDFIKERISIDMIYKVTQGTLERSGGNV